MSNLGGPKLGDLKSEAEESDFGVSDSDETIKSIKKDRVGNHAFCILLHVTL